MFIRNTSPTIQQTIAARETNPLKITYTIPIVFSIGTITIFQSNGSSNPGIVRQTINGLNNQNYLTFDNDTVSIDIIESTFNNPGSTYYVMIENNFVSTLSFNEPLPGLYSNIWSFTTLPEEEKEKGRNKIKLFFDGIYGKVRLTKNGTSYFDTLNSNQINKFFNNLTQELADAVAVTSKRIITNYRFVIDTNIESSSKQYLLSIKIDKPQSTSDRETKLITKDLDTMIRNMDITVLASGSSSKYLEPLYGYVTIPRWYENSDNICQLVLTVIFILILTMLCIISIHYDAKIEVKSDANSSVWKAFFYIMKSGICKLIQPLNLCKRRKVNERKVVDEEKVSTVHILYLIKNQMLT
ncbi:hypothetical protein C1646_268362 [Rhizophagus diaphanus]|nr:hypothetical protein C1646_268362 [Rhizophagus diaphanus] [Rhizophagus sp. MUCL 43196]